MPFGTKLKVTNPKNGRSVVVVINDRGPFKTGYDFAITPKVALELGADKNTESIDIEVGNPNCPE